MQSVKQADLVTVGRVECGRAHNPARQLVCHAQHNAAAALVGQRAALADKFLEVVPVLGLLELDVLCLAVEQQSLLEVVFISNDHVSMWACR